jgi:hypothetical protein
LKQNKLSLFLFLFFTIELSAQTNLKTDSINTTFTLSGYSELYFGYDGQFSAIKRPDFLYNFNRNKQFNTNLSYIKARLEAKRFRSNLALASGTYMQSNYTAEKGIFKYVFEGNAGVKLFKDKEIWLDVGIMPSHIGFESAIGKDNWNLTRSILAENSPYFENGIKLSYSSLNGKLTLAGMILQGWQRIRRLEGNSKPSFGAQVLFKPTSSISFNYSNFLGTDTPDTTHRFRHFHNLYGIFSLSDKLGLITGMDIGMEQSAIWYSLASIFRYTFSEKWAISLRGELYRDKNGVIIRVAEPNGFHARSFSLNVDFAPKSRIFCRVEGRWFTNVDLYTFSTSYSF